MNEEEIKYKGLNITDSEREFTEKFGKDMTGKDDNSFTIMIPLPFQKVRIISATAQALGGISVDNILQADYEYARMIITLNYVITKHPKWWDGADKCPDDDFLYELWKFFLESEQKFQKFIKKN